MKKAIAIFMAVIVCCCCMSVSAFAQTSTNDGGSFTAYYSIQSSYMIWIPEDVSLNQQNYLEAELLNITADEQINVRVSNLNSSGKLEMTDAYGNTLQVSISNDGLIGVFTDNTTSDISYFAMDEGGKAGHYSGTVEFTMQLTSRNS